MKAMEITPHLQWLRPSTITSAPHHLCSTQELLHTALSQQPTAPSPQTLWELLLACTQQASPRDRLQCRARWTRPTCRHRDAHENQLLAQECLEAWFSLMLISLPPAPPQSTRTALMQSATECVAGGRHRKEKVTLCQGRVPLAGRRESPGTAMRVHAHEENHPTNPRHGYLMVYEQELDCKSWQIMKAQRSSKTLAPYHPLEQPAAPHLPPQEGQGKAFLPSH